MKPARPAVVKAPAQIEFEENIRKSRTSATTIRRAFYFYKTADKIPVVLYHWLQQVMAIAVSEEYD